MAARRRGKEAAANDDTETVQGPPIDVDALLKDARFDATNLIGSVGDFLLQDLRATHELKSWAKMTEREQELLIDRAGRQADSIVRAVVEAIAAKGITHMHAQMEDAGSFKDGFFTLKVSVPMTAENALLLSKRNGTVQIVFADAKEFEGAMAMRAEPDQQALIDDEEDDSETEEEEADVTQQPEKPAPVQAPAPGM